MVQRLASLVLRLYPREWRARYEDEVRALFEEQPPSAADLPGLVGNAAREWRHAAIDPLSHSTLWTAVTGLGLLGRLAFAMACMYGFTITFAAVLGAAFGAPPDWVAVVAPLGILIVQARALVAQAWFASIPMSIRLRPLSRRELVGWGSVLLACAIGITWSDPARSTWYWWAFTLQWLLSATPAAWVRASASRDYWNARREWQYALSEHARLARLEPRGLSTSTEVLTALAGVQRLAEQARAAARASRVYGPIPSATPLNLN